MQKNSLLYFMKIFNFQIDFCFVHYLWFCFLTGSMIHPLTFRIFEKLKSNKSNSIRICLKR